MNPIHYAALTARAEAFIRSRLEESAKDPDPNCKTLIRGQVLGALWLWEELTRGDWNADDWQRLCDLALGQASPTAAHA